MAKLNGFDIGFKENIIKIILKLKITSLFILLVVPGLFLSDAQASYPADTILVPENTTITKRMGILPAAGEDFYWCLSTRYFLGIGYSFVSRF